MKIPAKRRVELERLQKRFTFRQPLAYYYMGKSGKPEEIEQKTFYHCIKENFPTEVGYEVETIVKKGIPTEREVCHAIVVATADLFDSQAMTDKHGNRFSKKMDRAKKMGYQPGTIDFIIFYPAGRYSSWGCEAKAGRNTASNTQKKTVAMLLERGMYCHVCRNFTAMLDSWLTYLGL